MAGVTKGGVTASGKSSKKATVGGSASELRHRLDADGKELQKGVVFQANCDHLWLRPPGPKLDASGNRIGNDAGLYMDFGGIGKTQEYDLSMAKDAAYVKEVRSIIEADLKDANVHKYNIREVKPSEPALPFSHFDQWASENLKIAILSKLSGDHDENVRLVKEIARYEVANLNRDDVLGMLNGLLATEAGVSDAFAVEVSLV